MGVLASVESALTRDGSDSVVVGTASREILDALLSEGRRFFELPVDHKETVAASATGTMTGWRKIGVEYSQTPDRPDLNETYCFRHRDDSLSSVPQHPLRDACRKAQTVLDAIAADVLAMLAETVSVGGQVAPIRTFEESWLQLNWSRPATTGREFIQDAHEDGHLLTFLFADAAGLEILDLTQGWIPVSPSSSRLIVFAGECGALLVNGTVVPTLHRVRARADVTTRLSVAYFVNPDLDQSLDPWIPGQRNAGVDLLTWGQQNPARFGLPVL